MVSQGVELGMTDTPGPPPSFNRLNGGGVLEVTFKGYVTAAVIAQLVPATTAALEDAPARFVVIETAAVSGYSPDVRAIGSQFLSLLKEHGVEAVYLAAPNAAVRMIGAALSMATGARLRIKHGREAVDAHIAQQMVEGG